jgi:hypothetical protein
MTELWFAIFCQQFADLLIAEMEGWQTLRIFV